MNPLDAAKSLRGSVHVAGGAFLTAPETYARAPGIGLEPTLDYYIAGRCGVLGDAPAGVVVAAAVFIDPQMVTAAWERTTVVCSARDAAADLAEACHDWGRAHYAGSAAAVVAELGGRVVRSASPVAAPLFAGWRALPTPADLPAAAALVLQQLRELRMARHAVAITAEGLTPLEAIVAGPGGSANAQMFGWAEPYPDGEALSARRNSAEALTNQMSAQDLAPLGTSDLLALVEAAAELRASV
jgi:hypothetical protein